MFPGPVYLTSDVHLGAIGAERAGAFRKWLSHAAGSAGTIVINGDLFDFWFEYDSVIPRGHTRTLGLLAEVVDSGIPVVAFGGNHDWWGGSYLRQEIGLDFRQEPAVLNLAGWRTLLAHGDGIGDGDLGYRILRAIIRSRLAQWAFRWLHPDVGARVARGVSLTESRPTEPSPTESRRATALLRWAEAELKRDAHLDVVALGHTHIPELHRVDAGERGAARAGYYVNSGDWVHHSTYVILSEDADAPQMNEWPMSATGADIPDGSPPREPLSSPSPQGDPHPHSDPHGPR